MEQLTAVIVVPTYNEVENIEHALGDLHRYMPDAHVLVVDDASPDGTGALADVLAHDDMRVHVLHRRTRNGLGGAYLDGFAWALQHDFDLVGEYDADRSHPASALPSMRDALQADASLGLAIGSRWVEGGSVVHWPKSRELLSRAGNAYARFMLGVEVHDVTAGFRLYRTSLLRRMELLSVASKGYCFQVDLTVRTIAAGGRVIEVPIRFQDRVVGASKMSRSIIAEAMGLVTLWGLARILGRPGRWIAARVGRPVVSLRQPT